MDYKDTAEEIVEAANMLASMGINPPPCRTGRFRIGDMVWFEHHGDICRCRINAILYNAEGTVYQLIHTDMHGSQRVFLRREDEVEIERNDNQQK